MMTLDKTIQEKKEMSISKWISDKICSYCNVDKKNYQKMKYGIDIIYINISKTAVLIILSVILGIVKETLLLLSVFTCVRLSGFGYIQIIQLSALLLVLLDLLVLSIWQLC